MMTTFLSPSTVMFFAVQFGYEQFFLKKKNEFKIQDKKIIIKIITVQE